MSAKSVSGVSVSGGSKSPVVAMMAGACAVVWLLASCGSSDGSGTPSTTPATATTNTAAPTQTSTGSAVTVNSTAPETTTGQTATTAVATTTPSTKAPATTLAEPVGGDEYLPATPPKAPGQTAEVKATGTQPDGVYYGTVSEGGDPPPANGAVVFELVQLFVGEECTQHFAADNEDACLNDYGVETDPTGLVEVPLGDQYVTVVDSATQQSYRITGPELYRLIQGEQPAEGAPPDYFYSGFGYFVTIENGDVTRLEQWWTP